MREKYLSEKGYQQIFGNRGGHGRACRLLCQLSNLTIWLTRVAPQEPQEHGTSAFFIKIANLLQESY